MTFKVLVGLLLASFIGIGGEVFAQAFLNRHEGKKAVEVLSRPFDPTPEGFVGICSFNIQWLGHWHRKKVKPLAQLVKNCDAVVVQEMVAPAIDVFFETSRKDIRFRADKEASAFWQAMQEIGFDGIEMAQEDTGPNRNHSYSTSSEWPVLFYKSDRMKIARDLPNGYLDKKLVKHPIFPRVPYAFGLRGVGDHKTTSDFVLISVHMRPMGAKGESPGYAKAMRVAEFQTVARWIKDSRRFHPSEEQDYFILGDMNVENAAEMDAYFGEVAPELRPYIEVVRSQLTPYFQDLYEFLGYISLNRDGTDLYGTNINRTKPFDHVMYEPGRMTVEVVPRLHMIDLAVVFRLDSYEKTMEFVQHYSDHNPLKLDVRLSDDGD